MSWISKLKLVVDNSDKLQEAVDKSKQALGENAEKINSVIDKVTSTADSKTGGKYSERISQLKDSAKGGVSNLAADGTAPANPAAAEPVAPVAPEPVVPDAEVVEES